MIIENKTDCLKADFTAMEIYNNPKLYSFLISYYLPELDDPYFNREIEQAENMRLFLSEQFAAWLPWDKNYSKNKSVSII